MTTPIRSFRELRVYQGAFTAAMKIFVLSRSFPAEERYSLTDQIRRASRSVCANLGEAWRKRRYPAHFVSKLSDAESEAEECRVFLEFAVACGYLPPEEQAQLDQDYDHILSQLVAMINRPDQWTVRSD